MNIFKKIFGTTVEETNQQGVSPIVINNEETAESANDQTVPAEQNENIPRIYTITYGTHMAIDAIYMYLDKNFEEDGFKDAMCSVDCSYKDSRERIIRNELKTLFRRVSLKYKDDNRKLLNTIRMVKEQGLLDQASVLESKMDTIQEHMEEIKRMEELLDSNDPSMMRPIESYRRGFLKGLTAKTNELIND